MTGMNIRSVTDLLLSRLTVPSPGDDPRMSDVLVDTGKRPLSSSSDFVSSIMAGVAEKRRFTGGEGLGAFRAAMPAEMSERLSVVDTGFSTTNAQTDQMINVPIALKAFTEAWHQDYVEQTPLWCSRVEPDTHSLSLYTVASPAVLNFGLELRAAAAAVAGVAPDLRARIEDHTYSLGRLMPTTGDEFGEMWNFLGPMTGFLDSGLHSSNAQVRAAQNAERMLTYSIFNRARIFNFFGSHLVKGDYIYFCAKNYDLTHMRNIVDPRGHAVAARRGRDTESALQVMGASSRHIHTSTHNSSYTPEIGPDSFTDPARGDADYVARLKKVALDYNPVEVREDGSLRFVYSDKESQAQAVLALSGDVNTRADEVPQLVYDAYMEGYCQKVGYVRAKEGRDPTDTAIAEGHRSHEAMKKLQSLTIYHM